VTFLLLQTMDAATTLLVLARGGAEGNPLLSSVAPLFGGTFGALLAAKAAAAGLGTYCWWHGRRRLLVRVSLLYAAVVVWNLLVIAAS
jgi:hypothetical protein